MCVLHSGQSGVSRQNRGVRLCVLHRRQLRSAGQYGRVGILFINDLVAAVTAVVTAIIVRGLRRDDNDRLGFGDGGVVVADMSLSGSRLGLGDRGNMQSFRIGGLVGVGEVAFIVAAFTLTLEDIADDLREALVGAACCGALCTLNAAGIKGTVRAGISRFIRVISLDCGRGLLAEGQNVVRAAVALRDGRANGVVDGVVALHLVVDQLQTLKAQAVVTGILSVVNAAAWCPSPLSVCAVDIILFVSGVGGGGHIADGIELSDLGIDSVLSFAVLILVLNNCGLIIAFASQLVPQGISDRLIIILLLQVVSHLAGDLIEPLAIKGVIIVSAIVVGQLIVGILVALGVIIPDIALLRGDRTAQRCVLGVGFVHLFFIRVCLSIPLLIRVFAEVTPICDVFLVAVCEREAIAEKQTRLDLFLALFVSDLERNIGIKTEAVKVGRSIITLTLGTLRNVLPAKFRPVGVHGGLSIIIIGTTVGIALLDVEQVPDVLTRHIVVGIVGNELLLDNSLELFLNGNFIQRFAETLASAVLQVIASRSALNGIALPVFAGQLELVTRSKLVDSLFDLANKLLDRRLVDAALTGLGDGQLPQETSIVDLDRGVVIRFPAGSAVSVKSDNTVRRHSCAILLAQQRFDLIGILRVRDIQPGVSNGNDSGGVRRLIGLGVGLATVRRREACIRFAIHRDVVSALLVRILNDLVISILFLDLSARCSVIRLDFGRSLLPCDRGQAAAEDKTLDLIIAQTCIKGFLTQGILFRFGQVGSVNGRIRKLINCAVMGDLDDTAGRVTRRLTHDVLFCNTLRELGEVIAQHRNIRLARCAVAPALGSVRHISRAGHSVVLDILGFLAINRSFCSGSSGSISRSSIIVKGVGHTLYTKSDKAGSIGVADTGQRCFELAALSNTGIFSGFRQSILDGFQLGCFFHLFDAAVGRILLAGLLVHLGDGHIIAQGLVDGIDLHNGQLVTLIVELAVFVVVIFFALRFQAVVDLFVGRQLIAVSDSLCDDVVLSFRVELIIAIIIWFFAFEQFLQLLCKEKHIAGLARFLVRFLDIRQNGFSRHIYPRSLDGTLLHLDGQGGVGGGRHRLFGDFIAGGAGANDIAVLVLDLFGLGIVGLAVLLLFGRGLQKLHDVLIGHVFLGDGVGLCQGDLLAVAVLAVGDLIHIVAADGVLLAVLVSGRDVPGQLVLVSVQFLVKVDLVIFLIVRDLGRGISLARALGDSLFGALYEGAAIFGLADDIFLVGAGGHFRSGRTGNIGLTLFDVTDILAGLTGGFIFFGRVDHITLSDGDVFVLGIGFRIFVFNLHLIGVGAKSRERLVRGAVFGAVALSALALGAVALGALALGALALGAAARRGIRSLRRGIIRRCPPHLPHSQSGAEPQHMRSVP